MRDGGTAIPDPLPSGPPPLVKICGLTSIEEALAAASAGAHWIGLNFHPTSPRRVDPGLAAEISAALPAEVEAVGLFVDRPPREVAATAARVGLGVVQLHGHEPPGDVAALASEGLRVVRAFRLKDRATLAAIADYLDRAAPFAVLVDAYVAGVAGGTGRSIDDDLLDRLPPLPRLILAGGLTPENVADRVARVRPWMVDVAGGVESRPGRKDSARVSAFVRAARAVPTP